jgi:hypothetical protein
MRTRTVRIGKLTVLIQNVPEGTSEDVLRTMALMKLFELNQDKAVSEMKEFKKAS